MCGFCEDGDRYWDGWYDGQEAGKEEIYLEYVRPLEDTLEVIRLFAIGVEDDEIASMYGGQGIDKHPAFIAVTEALSKRYVPVEDEEVQEGFCPCHF